MGITPQGLDFLLSAGDHGVNFERTITIGRQFLLVDREQLTDRLGRSAQFVADGSAFADRVFEYLGASEVCSIDASDFEGATHIHDMNTPIPDELKGRFTAVIDGGCLEHVFDFPTAMRNTMQLVEPGGHLLGITPANNAAGHGFYQFSPELFFRVLSAPNGFEMQQMLLAEEYPGAMWYRVSDPAVDGGRVEFSTRRRAYLYIRARRTGDVVPLQKVPVQSDYRARWDETTAEEPAPATGGLVPAPRTLQMLKSKAWKVAVDRVPDGKMAAAWRRHRFGPPLDPRYFEALGGDLRRQP